jgi:hypothetical protein
VSSIIRIIGSKLLCEHFRGRSGVRYCNISLNEHNKEIKPSEIRLNGIKLGINSRWNKILLIRIFLIVFCRELEEEYRNPNECIRRKEANVKID